MPLAGFNVVRVWTYSVVSCMRWRVLKEGILYSVPWCVSFTYCPIPVLSALLLAMEWLLWALFRLQELFQRSVRPVCRTLAEAAMFLLHWMGRFVCSDREVFPMKTVMRRKLSTRDCQMQMFWRKTRMRKCYRVLKVQINSVYVFKTRSRLYCTVGSWRVLVSKNCLLTKMHVCQFLGGGENRRLFHRKNTFVTWFLFLMGFFLNLLSSGCNYCVYGLASEGNDVSM